MRRELMSDSYDQRTRLYFDPDAEKLDAATVTMLDMELTVYPVGGEVWSFERLKAECIRTASLMRSRTSGLAPVNPYPGDLIPYAEIVLTDRARIVAQTRLSAIACDIHSDHTDASRAMERVNALGEAADIIDFLDAKQRRAK